MSMSITFDNHHTEQLATNRGWENAFDWISRLSVREFPHLTSLAFHGHSDRLPFLVAEIDHALRAYRPPSQEIISTIQHIRNVIKSQEHSAHLVMVTNGMVPSR